MSTAYTCTPISLLQSCLFVFITINACQRIRISKLLGTEWNPNLRSNEVIRKLNGSQESNKRCNLERLQTQPAGTITCYTAADNWGKVFSGDFLSECFNGVLNQIFLLSSSFKTFSFHKTLYTKCRTKCRETLGCVALSST